MKLYLKTTFINYTRIFLLYNIPINVSIENVLLNLLFIYFIYQHTQKKGWITEYYDEDSEVFKRWKWN